MQWRLIEVASFGEGPKGELSFLHCTHSLRRGKLPAGCDDDDDDKESWASTNYVLMMVIAVVQLRRISHAGLDELLSALFVSSKKFSLIFFLVLKFFAHFVSQTGTLSWFQQQHAPALNFAKIFTTMAWVKSKWEMAKFAAIAHDHERVLNKLSKELSAAAL